MVRVMSKGKEREYRLYTDIEICIDPTQELSAQLLVLRVARAFETRLATGSPPTCTISMSSRVWPKGMSAPWWLPAFELFDTVAAENETAREACAAKPPPLEAKEGEFCESMEGWG